MDPFSDLSYLLSPITVFLACLILVALVWRAAPARTSTRLFFGVLFSIGIWSSLILGMRTSPDPEQAYLWEKATPALFHAAFVFYYHFTLKITNAKGQKVIIIIAYLSLLVVAALTPTQLILESMRAESYGYAPVLGPLGIGIGFLDILLMVGGGINLFKRYRISSSYEDKNRILYLIIALVFPLLGAFLDGFTNLPPLAIWCNLVFCVLCSVAIIKYHLLDIRVVFRKSLVYLLVSVIVAAPYILILYSLRFVSYPPSEIWWVQLLVLLLFAVVLRPLHSWAQHLVDRWFYRDRYDRLKALEGFIHEYHSITNLEQLVSNMVSLTRNALKASIVCLLLPSETKDSFIVASCLGLNSRFAKIMVNDSRFLKWLESQDYVVSFAELDTFTEFKSFTPEEKGGLENIGVKLCVPIKTREGKLSGILLLGEKLGQQVFSNEDKELLYTLGTQMAMALENARLYDSEKATRIELEKLNEQKTEFLHQVAHELKTPLTAVISSSEILSGDSSMPSGFRERLINNIRTSAGSMNKRVTELIGLARTQVDEIKVEPAPLEMSRVISETTSQLDVIFQKKGQTLILEIPDLLPKVNADRGKLEQVLFNLLSNANKFSPIGSDIVLRAREVDRKIIVEVEDSASVVTEREKERIFDPYYRSEDTDKRMRFPGLGLGLAITRKLVELHGGEIWVENRQEKGNTFAFSLSVSDQGTNEIK
ncbi:ATP-binding protein [Chloroflexota bacterium]